MPPEDNRVSGAPTVASQLFAEFHEVHREFVDRISRIADKSMEVNKQVVSLHERILLLNLGTVGVSVSAIISFGAKVVVSSPDLKHAFSHFIAPSWVLLLLSALMCRNVMVGAINANRRLVEGWTKKEYSFNLGQLQRLLLKMSKALTGTISVDGVQQDISARFTDNVKLLQGILAELAKEPNPSEISREQRASKINSFLSVVFMQVGLILLCVGAIKLFLLF